MSKRTSLCRCLMLVLPAAILLVSSGPASETTASSVPVKDAARISLRDTYTGALLWYYNNPGDYNQDGIVNASDITPLGLHFGEIADSGSFWEGSAQWLIDGDHNGVINAADITPIGANFGNALLGGFNVYEARSLDDYPVTNAGPNSAVARLLGHIDLADTITNPSEIKDRLLEFSFQVSDPVEGYFYWVRPVGLDGSEGIPSEPVAKLGYKAPTSSHSTALAWWEESTHTLTWLYANAGDANQDGVVDPADLTAIGQHFLEQSPGFPAPWPEASIMYMIDVDSNGEINVADIGAMAANTGNLVCGYNIYASLNAQDYPQANDEVSSIGPFVSGIEFADFADHVERTRYDVVIKNHVPGMFYWVRPYDYLGYEGTPSNLVDTD